MLTAEEIKARQIAAGTYKEPPPKPVVPEYINQIMADDRYKERQKVKDERPKFTVSLKAKLEMKIRAIALKGGKCCLCGYSRCLRALEFHHVDPSVKDFTIATFISREFYRSGWDATGLTDFVWKKVERELTKCVLLCSNCHREVEAGVTELSKGIENGA